MKLVVFEGPQGSGKTTAAKHLSQHGYYQTRGIPEGAQLISNSEPENWRHSLRLLDEGVASGIRYCFDRSIWSLVVFNMTRQPYRASLIYRLGRDLFQRRIKEINCWVVILEADAEECLLRERKEGPLALQTVGEVEKEIQAYGRLANNLSEDGFNVLQLKNRGVSKVEYLAELDKLFS